MGRNAMKWNGALLGLICMAMFLLYQENSRHMQHDIAQKILRFHVRANSDSHIDQQLKLEVRDAVGAYLEPRLEQVEDIGECRRVVQANLPQVIRVAEKTLDKAGYPYPVRASLGDADFPPKTYGAYTFPPGRYQALNLDIGEGKGHNWWCVLYPNMCFHGSLYEVVDAESKTALRQVLSEDEYDAVLRSGKYRIRLKCLKLFAKN